jgi:hypothetical protein
MDRNVLDHIMTLRNISTLDAQKEKYRKINSIDSAVTRKAFINSLKDNGIDRFKEIKDINKISFGHFIVLEKIINLENIDSDKKIEIIAPYLLRPLNEEKLDNEDEDKEAAHKELVFSEPIGNIYGAFNRYMDIRHQYLYKTYNGVIYGTLNDDDDEDEEDEEDGKEISTNSGKSAREFHNKKFFWNALISDVAQGDIFKFPNVVELYMYIVMPYLAEKRSLEIVTYLEHKANR